VNISRLTTWSIGPHVGSSESRALIQRLTVELDDCCVVVTAAGNARTRDAAAVSLLRALLRQQESECENATP